MHGSVSEVIVKTVDSVNLGSCLVIVDAMVMRHDILAEIDGVIQDVVVSIGNQVAASALLVEIEAAQIIGIRKIITIT
jgi:biotin carboxyl carrier protein